jgi:hypothetical protein
MSEKQFRLQEANRVLLDKQYKWSWAKFCVGIGKNISDKAFWVWCVYQVMAARILELGSAASVIIQIIMVSGCVGVTVIFLLGDNFKRGFESLLANNVKINADLSAKLEKLINIGGVNERRNTD